MMKGDLVTLLKDCGKRRDLNTGSRIHEHAVRKGLLRRDLYISSSLIGMYARCGEISRARKVFDELAIRNVVSWTSLISGYMRCDLAEEALKLLDRMSCEGVAPNSITFSCALAACGDIESVEKGEEIHALIQGCCRDEEADDGGDDDDPLLATALLDMYAKCGFLSRARQVFGMLKSRDVVAWTALIAAHARQAQWEEALSCFAEMQLDGLAPNAATILCILNVCASARASSRGEEMHLQIVRGGLLSSPKEGDDDVRVWNALVDMYAKCGRIAEARDVVEGLAARDVVSWASLMGGYVQRGHGEAALGCLESMQREGIPANPIALLCALRACGSIGSIGRGKQIHAAIAGGKPRPDDEGLRIGNALVDAYARCGAHGMARGAFDRLAIRDVVSWTALISSYAQLGNDELVADSLRQMAREGVEPNTVTFTVVLCGCSHSGLLDLARSCGEALHRRSHGPIPSSEHSACLVDLLGRAGRFDEAFALIRAMPTSCDYLPLWSSLLGACQKWGNPELARLAFEHALQLDESHASSYVGMCNVYC